MSRTTWLASPLADAGGPLDERQRSVVAAMAAAERAAAPALPGDAPLDPERRRRVGATTPELLGQPAAVRATWAANDEDAGRPTGGLAAFAARLADDADERRLRRVLLAGAGDSLAVLDAARAGLEAGLGLPCQPLGSLDLALYPPPDLGPDVLVITLSSSGETARTVEAALVAQAAGAATLALTNTPGSSLARESRDALLVRATRTGWPTQSSTAALALLLRLAALAGLARGLPGAAEHLAALDAVPEAMAAVLAATGPRVREVVARAGDDPAQLHRVVVFAAGGPDWGAAVMGAAKVRECTPGHALAIGVEEFHHYNSLKAGEPLWLLAPDGPSLARAVDTAREAVRWGGRVHAVVTTGQHALDDLADDVLELPAPGGPLPGVLSPLLSVLPAQLVGLHLALAQFAAAERAAAPSGPTGGGRRA